MHFFLPKSASTLMTDSAAVLVAITSPETPSSHHYLVNCSPGAARTERSGRLRNVTVPTTCLSCAPRAMLFCWMAAAGAAGVGIPRRVVKNVGLILNKSIYSGPLLATLEDRLENVNFGVKGLSGLTQGPRLAGRLPLSGC